VLRKYWGRFNFETLVIIAILLTDTGHTGSYLATFEMPSLRFLGYIQALTIDAAALICAYRMRRKSQRQVAILAWAFFCSVTAWLNSMYYIQAGVTVPQAVALGCWSPLAVLLVGWLKGGTDALSDRSAKAAATRAERKMAQAEAKAKVASIQEEEAAEEAKVQPVYICPVADCGRSFANQNGLNAHMRVHSKEDEQCVTE